MKGAIFIWMYFSLFSVLFNFVGQSHIYKNDQHGAIMFRLLREIVCTLDIEFYLKGNINCLTCALENEPVNMSL